jgi:hypothetical protein
VEAGVQRARRRGKVTRMVGSAPAPRRVEHRCAAFLAAVRAVTDVTPARVAPAAGCAPAASLIPPQAGKYPGREHRRQNRGGPRGEGHHSVAGPAGVCPITGVPTPGVPEPRSLPLARHRAGRVRLPRRERRAHVLCQSGPPWMQLRKVVTTSPDGHTTRPGVQRVRTTRHPRLEAVILPDAAHDQRYAASAQQQGEGGQQDQSAAEHHGTLSTGPGTARYPTGI